MITKLLTLNIPRLIEIAKKSGSCGCRARHKLAILKRDGFKCVSCGKVEELTIAHIHQLNTMNKRIQHRNASSYKFDECKTQCVTCHIEAEHTIRISK